MSRRVLLPPTAAPLTDGTRLGGWWHDDPDEAGRIVCDLCPRDCHLRPGDRGFCFVRENRSGEMVLSTYGRSTGFCIDPIEKKPLNQFYPGTSVLSFGTAGCNLGCKFCQNWSISKSREIERLSETASPETIAAAAQRLGCRSVAFTYNDPVVWAEYAIDTARACREAGVKTVAVTAGYITPAARGAFYEHIDAANVDLKGFTEEFYQHLTLSHLEPVKETLRWLVHETNVWTEITNLIIPRENDSTDELREMCDWILAALGPEVPVHFTAFHPDFRLNDRPRTPAETLLAAYDIATAAGLRYVYVGNIHAPKQQTTYCPGCRAVLIERVGYDLRQYTLEGNRCRSCGREIAGHYDERPGNWGSKRQPVRIGEFAERSPMSIQSPTNSPGIDSLSASQERAILQTACRLLAAEVVGVEAAIVVDELAGTAELPVLGAFVSLKRQGHLRSCCGTMGQNQPLAAALAMAAKRSASDDPRFPSVTSRELAHLDVEVWLLHSLKPIAARGEARREAIEIGKHGLQIARGQARGLLLPGVATEHGLSAEAFLEQVAIKAQLPPTAWKENDTSLWTFEGKSLQAAVGDVLSSPAASSPPKIGPRDLPGLADFCRRNLRAMTSGATPDFFAPGVADGNVSGIVVSVCDGEGREMFQGHRLVLRGSFPLQSTLFGLLEKLAQATCQQRLPAATVRSLEPRLAVLTEPAMHGTLAAPDLRGLDPSREAIVISERGKTVLVFDPEKSAEAVLQSAAEAIQVTSPAQTQVWSLAIATDAPRLRVAQVPQAVAGQAVRPPAVAGTFYPADPQELEQLVECSFPTTAVQQQRWPAVMVPHAGLVYSGRIAADVFRRIRFPSTAIIIGPKHTPHGVDWAVAPHESWSIPGATLPGDLPLARRLAESIPGLTLDAAAHAREHAIEVELPFIARLAPTTKIVGIVIGSGDLARCRQFATGLAEVIRSLPDLPLLVISSDMNHFASDAENRRLDELALAAMETLDPERLYETATNKRISMCGLLPAVIVMETLRLLSRLNTIERVAYATSADVSGDKSRVVGYAGMLLGTYAAARIPTAAAVTGSTRATEPSAR